MLHLQIARTGDIIALGGLKDVITGETLCDEKAPIMLERMEFPDPVIKVRLHHASGQTHCSMHNVCSAPHIDCRHDCFHNDSSVVVSNHFWTCLAHISITATGCFPSTCRGALGLFPILCAWPDV